ncbi:MAG: hypothetical protein R3F54_05175 [Alphaproteobacteria bacterium]
MDAVRRYFKTTFATMARKGALMSRKEARAFYLLLAISPLLIWFFAYTALEKGAEGSWEEYLCWALVGLFATALISFPATLYGYHHRDRIETGNEKPHDLSGIHRAAVAGVVGVPLVREAYRWLTGN